MEDKIDADRRRFLGAAVMIKQTDWPTPTPNDANQTMVSYRRPRSSRRHRDRLTLFRPDSRDAFVERDQYEGASSTIV